MTGKPYLKRQGHLIARHCEACRAFFYAPQSTVRRGNGRFCSRSCGAKRSGSKPAETVSETVVELKDIASLLRELITVVKER